MKQPTAKSIVSKTNLQFTASNPSDSYNSKNRTVLKHFLTSLSQQPEEYDLEFEDLDDEQVKDIVNIKKLKSFSP